MSDLVAFLRECLDADEQAAQAAQRNSGHPEWGSSELSDSIYTADTGSPIVSGPYDYLEDGLKDHITRWDPARVLAEVESKRRILDHIQPIIEHWDECVTPGCKGCRQEWSRKKELLRFRFVLVPMTLPYQDRPGYDPAWGEA